MDQTIVIWCVIVGILALVFVIHAVDKRRGSRDNPHPVRHHHFIELGKEREMFFIPGDRKDDGSED